MGQQQSINKNQSKEKLILLEIQTKKGVSFIDKVKAVTTYNARGTFDILPEHENFISIIKNKIIIHMMDGEDKEIKIDTGVLKVYANEVHIFLGLTDVDA